MTTLDKVLKDMEQLKHEKDFYQSLNECHVKMINRQVERIQEFTELISTLKMQVEELENDNEILKDKLGYSSDYLMDLTELKERQLKELKADNYKIKKRCNELANALASISIYYDQTIDSEENENDEI